MQKRIAIGVYFLFIMIYKVEAQDSLSIISGVVIDSESKRGIEKAKVRINGRTVETSTDGRFYFRFTPLFGTNDQFEVNNITVIKEGYKPQKFDKIGTWRTGNNFELRNELNISKEEKLVYSGLVIDGCTDKPIPDVRLIELPKDPITINNDGIFRVPVSPKKKGVINFHFTHENYHRYIDSIIPNFRIIPRIILLKKDHSNLPELELKVTTPKKGKSSKSKVSIQMTGKSLYRKGTIWGKVVNNKNKVLQEIGFQLSCKTHLDTVIQLKNKPLFRKKRKLILEIETVNFLSSLTPKSTNHVINDSIKKYYEEEFKIGDVKLWQVLTSTAALGGLYSYFYLKKLPEPGLPNGN